MSPPRQVWDRVYEVGGPTITGEGDASIWLVALDDMLVMIDCGTGMTWDEVKFNIGEVGLDDRPIRYLVLTHGHIDHIGAASRIKKETGCAIIAHEGDQDAIEGLNSEKTAASWYGIDYEPVPVDKVLTGTTTEAMAIGSLEFKFIHTPGHTPGSISVLVEVAEKKVLFGQDIHGPFDPSFGSNLDEWRRSMKRLIELDADILCEGHFGVFKPAEGVRRYIEGCLDGQ